MNETLPPEIAPVPFDRVSRLIRQLTHDVRNGLSAVDLEAAFIAELVDDPEASDELRKLRAMVANSARMLRDLSQNFQEVRLHRMPWAASIFFGELESRLFKQFPGAPDLHINSELGEEQIDVDLDQLCVAVAALVENAVHFREAGGAITLTARAENGEVLLELREAKKVVDNEIPPEEWGLEPFRSTRPGGYGLGLFRARRVIEAHGGTLEIRHDGEQLVSCIALPIHLG